MSFHILSLPSLCAAYGATGAVVMLCVVLQVLSLHHVWYCRCCRCTMHGTAGAVFVPCMVPQALSSHYAWYHRRCLRTVHGTAGAAIVLHVVSQGLLLCHMWCYGWCHWTVWSRGCGGHATCGVMVAIVAACDVVIMVPVVVPHVVHRSCYTMCSVAVTIVMPHGAARAW